MEYYELTNNNPPTDDEEEVEEEEDKTATDARGSEARSRLYEGQQTPAHIHSKLVISIQECSLSSRTINKCLFRCKIMIHHHRQF